MGKATIQGPKPNSVPHWGRQAQFVRLQAMIGPGEEIWPIVADGILEAHASSVLEGWASFIFELKTPITSVMGVIGAPVTTSEGFRIYPPFPLNRQAADGALFNDLAIPAGENVVAEQFSMPEYVDRGMSAQHAGEGWVICDGLRIDAAHSVEIAQLLPRFLALVRQYTMQWWVGSGINPFDIGIRMRFDMDPRFRPREILKHAGVNEIGVSWTPMATYQLLVGIERPLDLERWQNIMLCLQQNIGAESCIEFFLSAIENYRNGRDDLSILSLALMFETGENKARKMMNKKVLSKNKDLLRDLVCATTNDSETFRRLIIDRDNIAHGRKVVWAKSDDNFFLYFDSAFTFIQRYIDICAQFGWSNASSVSF